MLDVVAVVSLDQATLETSITTLSQLFACSHTTVTKITPESQCNENIIFKTNFRKMINWYVAKKALGGSTENEAFGGLLGTVCGAFSEHFWDLFGTFWGSGARLQENARKCILGDFS